jgi:manganese transport protein
VQFTSDRTRMGEFTNTRLLKFTGYTVAVLIAALNAWLLFQTIAQTIHH